MAAVRRRLRQLRTLAENLPPCLLLEKCGPLKFWVRKQSDGEWPCDTFSQLFVCSYLCLLTTVASIEFDERTVAALRLSFVVVLF